MNPDLSSFTLFITPLAGCKLQHFTASPAVPLQTVSLKWSGGVVALYDRVTLGTDCTDVLQWTVPEPAPYDNVYQFDLVADWNAPGSQVSLAGVYKEIISIEVIPTP